MEHRRLQSLDRESSKTLSKEKAHPKLSQTSLVIFPDKDTRLVSLHPTSTMQYLRDQKHKNPDLAADFSYDSDEETERLIIDNLVAENEDLMKTLRRHQERRREIVERLKRDGSQLLAHIMLMNKPYKT